jgi:hypothetical protein
MRSLHQQLLGHTAPDHASAAVAKALGNAHLGSQAGRHARGAHTARSTTDYKEIKVVLLHKVLSTKSRWILTGHAMRAACAFALGQEPETNGQFRQVWGL